MPDSGTKLVASNRKARRDFTILETFEAGLVLRGAEVKSLRTNQVQMADAYARFGRHDAWLEGVHIAPYSFATGTDQPDPDRPRKLLLHAAEIEKIGARVAQERLAVIPLSIYFREGRAKVELALARGRRKGDHRHAMAERDAQREAARALGRQRKGIVD
ncbi:MAG TPA: SsrA-binding protein SmpB [Acidimicrobiales bacterium]|jgi:SsrA-binding protein